MRQSIINKLNSNSMSKKVIEPVIIEQENGFGNITVSEDSYDVLIEQTASNNRLQSVYIDNLIRTTVAKAIDPEYQKVIDQNKFLEVENARLTKVYQKAVNKTHGLNATNAKLVEALEEITVQKIIDIMTENYNIFHGTNEADICSANEIVSLIKQSINQNKF